MTCLENNFDGYRPRDRALLATLLNHTLRREELCRLKINDIHPGVSFVNVGRRHCRSLNRTPRC